VADFRLEAEIRTEFGKDGVAEQQDQGSGESAGSTENS